MFTTVNVGLIIVPQPEWELPKGKVGVLSAEGPLALPESLDRTRSEGGTGEERRIERESSAKNVAVQPRLGHAILSRDR